MKRVVNPIPMYARRLGELPRALELPVVGKPIGFDLMKADWVPPYGKGSTSDLVFTVSEEIPYVAVDKRFAVTLKITFTNELDGIQSVFAPLNAGSQMRLPRFAPSGGYAPELIKRIGRSAEDNRWTQESAKIKITSFGCERW